MEKVHSFEPLAAYMHYPQGDGTALVYLRRNIEEETVEGDDGPMVGYVADEVSILVDGVDVSDVPSVFDELWDRAESASKTDAERIDEIASASSDSMAALGELGAMVSENVAATEELYLAVAELGVLLTGGDA